MNQNKLEDKSLKSGERAVKVNLKTFTAYQLYRYIAPYKFIRPTDNVIDLGCGIGHGTYLLAKQAKHVTGIDDSLEAIEFAKKYWKADNITYYCQNVMQVSDKFNVTVIHEVIEHIKDAEQLFQILSKITKRYLIFTVPTPQQKQTNPFHWKHYSPEEIKNLLTKNSFKLIRFDGLNLPFYVARKIK